MNTECKKEFTRQFLINNFNKTYINTEYKNHLKDIYFQKEISKLPETICIINASRAHHKRQREIKHIVKNMIQPYPPEINEQIEFNINLHQLYQYCYRRKHYIDIQNEPTTIQEIETYVNEMLVSNKKYIPKYVGRCPLENCKGFINTKYICELCSTHICDKCNVPITLLEPDSSSPHVCDESLVSTVQLIKKDTKPCPKCHINIYKIDGCDQMWCVECHTAFSWTTGEIEHKIHNPHYYEYLRNSNQTEKLLLLHNNNINGCNAEEEEYDFLNNFVINVSLLLRNLSIFPLYYNYTELKRFHDLYIGIERTLNHIEQVEIPINFYINTSKKLDDLREYYALNKITDEVYKSNVHQIYKRNAYNLDITQLLQTFIIIIKDLLKIHLSKLSLEKNTIQIKDIESMRMEFINIYGWVDNKLEEISNVFNYIPVCLAHDIYIPGCTIKSKSRVDTQHMGSAGFDIIYN